MAKISHLVQTVAALTDESPLVTAWRSRTLRQAGLISTFGRGRHGAEMTAVDAANLLIGVIAAEVAAGSYVASMRRLSEPHTPVAAQREPGRDWVALDIAALDYHYPNLRLTTFPDALASLLTSPSAFGQQLQALEVAVHKTHNWSGRLRVTLRNQVSVQLAFGPQPAPPLASRAILRSSKHTLSADDLASLALVCRPDQAANPATRGDAGDNERRDRP